LKLPKVSTENKIRVKEESWTRMGSHLS
jgi:hypothetical protein